MANEGWRAIAGEEFDAREAVGGTRGVIESAVPGVVFVAAYLIWGGFRIPTLAAVAVIVVAVIARVVQRQSAVQALSGTFGVLVGAALAWVMGAPEGYFVPGLVTNAATFVVLVASILVRRPLVGFVVAALRSASLTAWLRERALVRVMARATWVMAALFGLKLAVQVPLYYGGYVVALGVAKLAMGIPLFVVTAWVVWLVVRSAELPPAREDPPQPTR